MSALRIIVNFWNGNWDELLKKQTELNCSWRKLKSELADVCVYMGVDLQFDWFAEKIWAQYYSLSLYEEFAPLNSNIDTEL
jgi:hypothetical protein